MMLGSMADILQSSKTNTNTSTRSPSRRLCTHHCTAPPLIDLRNQRPPLSFPPRMLPRHGGALRLSSTTVSRSRDASAPAAAAWRILQLRFVKSFPSNHTCTLFRFCSTISLALQASQVCLVLRCSLAFSPLPGCPVC